MRGKEAPIVLDTAQQMKVSVLGVEAVRTY